MPAVTGQDHREQAALVRKLMAIYARSEDLVRIGAYKAGADRYVYVLLLVRFRSLLEIGKIEKQETVVEGLDQAEGAFIGLSSGNNIGKMVVKLA